MNILVWQCIDGTRYFSARDFVESRKAYGKIFRWLDSKEYYDTVFEKEQLVWLEDARGGGCTSAMNLVQERSRMGYMGEMVTQAFLE